MSWVLANESEFFRLMLGKIFTRKRKDICKSMIAFKDLSYAWLW